jgi:hypothetical protein
MDYSFHEKKLVKKIKYVKVIKPVGYRVNAQQKGAAHIISLFPAGLLFKK